MTESGATRQDTPGLDETGGAGAPRSVALPDRSYLGPLLVAALLGAPVSWAAAGVLASSVCDPGGRSAARRSQAATRLKSRAGGSIGGRVSIDSGVTLLPRVAIGMLASARDVAVPAGGAS